MFVFKQVELNAGVIITGGSLEMTPWWIARPLCPYNFNITPSSLLESRFRRLRLS